MRLLDEPLRGAIVRSMPERSSTVPDSGNLSPHIVAPLPRRVRGPKPAKCIAPHCVQHVENRGLCRAHYLRWWRHTNNGAKPVTQGDAHSFGPLCCVVCSRPLRDHKLTETCLEYGL